MASITIRGISEELRKKFKVMCVENNVSMNTRVLQLIEADVKQKHGKKETGRE